MASRSTVRLAQQAFLQGKTETARGCNRPVHAFLGVPFAAPPVGPRQFQPPEKLTYWTGTRDATEFGPICPQDLDIVARTYYPYPVPEKVSEDCLYLNMYTPSLNPDSKLAVMVWIHGGAFIQGFSNVYNGTALAAHHNVVFISINYRVGSFGFLCTGEDGVVKGNMGLLDQIAALEWIRDHVTVFGGDPDNVTIFGESAGGISVSHLIVSDMSRRLFCRAISQSGVSTHSGSLWTQKQAGRYLRSRVRKMGCTSTDSADILAFLREQPTDTLIRGLGIGFNPVLDHHLLKDLPGTLYDRGHFQPVDHMIGFNSHEGAQFVFGLIGSTHIPNKEAGRQFVERVIKKMFYRGVSNVDQVVKAVIDKYVEPCPDKELTQSLVDMYGHLLFIASSVDAANKHSEKGKTYLYMYDHRSPLSRHPEWVRADHDDEILLVLGEPYQDRFPDIWSDEDKQLSQKLMAYWTNFAKTGDPNGSGLPGWPAYSMPEKHYAVLGPDVRVRSNFDPDAVQFWCYKIPAIIKGQSKL